MTKTNIKWGILGPGQIATNFARGLLEAEGAHLVAVGSRDRDRAKAFAAEFGAARAYGSYEELAADPEVDAVYIGTPHSEHEAHAILCLEAGKHVLCEKPLALNAAQGGRMAAAARANDRILMEALWTRFLPAIVELRRQVAAGVIGDVRMVHADFGFLAPRDPENRLFNPALGGGTLLDIGIYPLNLAFMMCGEPLEIHTTANLGPTGVDEEAAILLRHEQGRLSVLSSSFLANTPRVARIIGTEGCLTIDFPWWAASRFTLDIPDEPTQVFEYANRGGGYSHEAEAFMDLIRTGARDSEVMPLSESLGILATMDRIRERWGVSYPGE